MARAYICAAISGGAGYGCNILMRIMPCPHRIIINGALWWLDFGPNLKIGHADQRRKVLAICNRVALLDLLTLLQELRQLLGCGLVLAKRPDPKETVVIRIVAPLGPFRARKCPAVFG